MPRVAQIFVVLTLLAISSSNLSCVSNNQQKIRPTFEELVNMTDPVESQKPEPTHTKSEVLNYITLRPTAPGEIVYHYSGIQGVIVSKIRSYHNRLWNMYINNLNLTPMEYEKMQNWYDEAEYDAEHGRWYDRTWQEAMVQSRGGAGPTQVYEIGHDIDIFNIGIVTLTNTGKIRIGDASIYLHTLGTENGTMVSSATAPIFHHREIQIYDMVKISFRPNLTLQIGLNPDNLISDLGFEVRCKFMTYHSSEPWAYITARCSSKPMQGDVQFTINFNLMCW